MDRLSELSYNFFCKMNKEKIMLSNLRGMDTFMLDYFTDKPLVGAEVPDYENICVNGSVKPVKVALKRIVNIGSNKIN